MKIGLVKLNKKISMDPSRWSHKGGENCHCAVIRYMLDQGHSVVILTPTTLTEDDVKAYGGRLELRPVGDFTKSLRSFDDLDAVVVFCGAMANDCNATRSFRKYIQPVINLLNDSMMPWVYVLADPRYWPKWLEMENKPLSILSQIEEVFTRKLSYEIASFKHTYAEVEKWQFYGVKPDPRKVDTWDQRPMDIVICSHEHSRGEKLPSKDPAWQLLDKFTGNYEVYGEWYSRDGPQYKGIVSRTEVQRLLATGRATFLVPIWNGWVTPKFYEACLEGTVPLINSIDPQIYDIGCNTGLHKDHFWRVLSGEIPGIDVLKEKVASLTRDDAAAAQEKITPDMMDGTVIERQLLDRLRNKINDYPLIQYLCAAVPIGLSILHTLEQSGTTEGIDLRRCELHWNEDGQEIAETFEHLMCRVGFSAAHELVQRIALKEIDGSIVVNRKVELPEYVKRREGPETCV